jgi:hypothetical protein
MIPKGLEKQINFLDFSLSSLWRRKLKNIGIMLVFSAVIFLLASFQMLTGALSDAASTVLDNAPEITIQRISAGRQEAIPLAYIEKLSKIFGIRKTVPRIWGYYFDESNLANYTVMAPMISLSQTWTMQEIFLPSRQHLLPISVSILPIPLKLTI